MAQAPKKNRSASKSQPAAVSTGAKASPLVFGKGVVIALLAILTFVLYARVGGFEFINFDDGDYVSENAHVRQGLTKEGILWAFTGTQVANWHPVTTLSLLLDSQLFGLNAGAFHLVNALFHVANTVLVFLLLHRLTGALWRSALVAALFAWHPLHVESVAWVSERKDVLSGFFGLLTLLAYARYVAQPKARHYLLALLFFALGLMSKPMLVTWPFVLLLLDWWPLNRLGAAGKSFGALVREKVPFFALCVLASVVTFKTQQHTGAVAATELYPFGDRLANVFVSYSRYVEKTFWPDNLAVFYPYPKTWPAWRLWSALLLLAIITAVAIRSWRRHAPLAMGWCLFLGTLVPVIGLVQVGSQSMADRYTYLPLLGVFIMVAWGGAALIAAGGPWKSLLPPLAVAALVGCFAASWRQIGHWRDSLTLFGHTIKVTHRNEFAHSILGQALEAKGRLPEAEAQYRESIRIQPKNGDVQFFLGSALAKQGRAGEAMAQFQAVLRLKPAHFEAHYNLASIFFQQGKLEDAVSHFKEAERLNPNSADCQSNLASTLLALNRYEPAVEHFNRALKLNPAHSHARVNLGFALSLLGRTPEAIAQFRETLRLAPDFDLALYRLAWLLATDIDPRFRDGAEAVRLAERLVKVTGGGNPAMLDTLAAAYAEAGRFVDAVRTEQQAIALAGQAGLAQMVPVMQQRLALYQNNTPYHAAARQ